MLQQLKYKLLVVWQIILLSLLLYIMYDASLWVYLTQQAQGQIGVIYHTQEVSEVLQEQSLTVQEKKKIKLIQQVKVYAENEFGLNKTSNYQTFYNQHGKPILWMLTACEPLSFEEKIWHFPFLGDVSYKGFFKHDLAFNEALPLKMQHLDVDIGKVSAWSTLGILADPILSSMLENDEGELSELIIHELTHATLYFANDVDFNENFASFVGRIGAMKFIEHTYGKGSPQWINYLEDIQDEDVLKSFILSKKEELAQFYSSLDKNMAYPTKIALKQKKLDKIVLDLYALDIYNWKTKIKIAYKIKTSANAYFMSYHRYDAQYDKLLAAFQQHGNNLKAFIAHAKQNKAIQ
jgi:predicted aminopeptidase